MSNEQALLDAVVDLTAQRDPDSLAQALVRSMAKLSGASKVSVYQLQGDLGNLSAKLIACTSAGESAAYITALKNRPELCACVDEQKVVKSSTRGCPEIIYPMMEDGTVTGMLICETDGGFATALAERMLQVYGNQFSLLTNQHRDGLTGLFNRAALNTWMEKALAPHPDVGRRDRDAKDIGCFAIFDIDHFKRINDSLGHLYGDEVLLIFADLMREFFRSDDLLFRYGGEEFVAVLTATALEDAVHVLERFAATVAGHNFPQIQQVTLTSGVALVEPRLLPSTLIDRADKALYHGKTHGRNQVNAYEWLVEGNSMREIQAASPQTIELF